MTPLILLAMASLTATAPADVAALKWQRRVLLISATTAQDPALAQQRKILAAWRTKADDRDLSIVEVIGNKISGATDKVQVLRKKYRLPSTGFTAILIGKDGGEKLRSATPLQGAQLEEIIDAMPMRRAGER
ncbi:DUF4174 domain-containing protein [Sphingomonas sp. GC_Shp_4]|uniref:DUF4174 domain-containing protein n=2 Tax=Sphingomonas TaxID=13687 RepID=UPI00226B0ABF|nr:DUF4174 domain-containing protein [Sphingomonas sp. GC_Shp_4]